jgi:hypothetical protein
MSLEPDFRERFLNSLPRLLKNSAFRQEVIDGLGERGQEILDRVQKRLPLGDGDEDELVDIAHDAYSNCAEQVLTLAWDGGAPGMSGAAWVSKCEGVYVIQSSDYDDLGPFSSLKEALQEECFNIVTANPELNSEVLSKTELLEIAKQVVDWENEGAIVINSEVYRASGNKLIPSTED